MSEVKNGRYEEFGNTLWYKDGKLHSEDGPAIEYTDGTKFWYFNGEPHRKYGPALNYHSGKKEWWFEGKLHREDGPAVEYPKTDGREQWWLHGLRHREDGPAVVWFNNVKQYFIYDIEYTEEEFNEYLTKKQLKDSLHSDLTEKEERPKVKI